MNYAVNSATAVAFSCRRSSTSVTMKNLMSPALPSTERRITINVGGERFQTYENTLGRYPDSLLGSPQRRKHFYDARKDELKFPKRNKNVFNAILFFYQAKILSRPEDIPLDVFLEEINFFDIAMYSHENSSVAHSENKTVTIDNSVRNCIWNFLEYPQTRFANMFAKFNLFLVFVWLLILCLETKVASNSEGFMGWKNVTWFVLDTVFVIWFTLDYVIHIICEPKLTSYIASLMGFIDIITILPYYIQVLEQVFGGKSLAPQLDIIRFLRVFRLFKANRYSTSFRILLGSLLSSAADFPVWFVLMFMHIVFFSSILYYVESDVDNPQFSNIPEVMYFTVITMCAVGYGDAVPKSALGKFMTTIAAVTGIVIVYCIPAPTLKTNFNRLNKMYATQKNENQSNT
ncbi:potassium voltage-gated channel subfamily A member 4-like [Xenia sp. Carnegie-2017]|uniref:potassium voltage-gated channel subfamily A member 4-like n=1 Tax=Xenia sp. Carnegie-2017 TaxID=2897299 RepID=UPI001F03910B|nr:potassium voltage-gated channel subfamily A member 4-like [Xenia sp. Carnegie-2017]XP_046864134.1 potassium voltage-gated channel subfamily A member 4-like [Xenia sp. Carnegie-2017]